MCSLTKMCEVRITITSRIRIRIRVVSGSFQDQFQVPFPFLLEATPMETDMLEPSRNGDSGKELRGLNWIIKTQSGMRKCFPKKTLTGKTGWIKTRPSETLDLCHKTKQTKRKKRRVEFRVCSRIENFFHGVLTRTSAASQFCRRTTAGRDKGISAP